MDKAKRSLSPRRKIFGCLGVIAVVIFACLGILNVLPSIIPFFYGQMPQTSLDPALAPSTEVLLTMPREVVVSDGISLSFWLIEIYGGLEEKVGYDFIYVTANVDALIYHNGDFDKYEYRNLLHNSRLSIDGVWVMGIEPNNMSCQGDDFNMDIDWCAWGHLQAGLHLIEFHLRDSSEGEAIHIQQWAIRIQE